MAEDKIDENSVEALLQKIRNRQQKTKDQNKKFSAMYNLAEKDPGMKDLLDRAEEYYFLKRS